MADVIAGGAKQLLFIFTRKLHILKHIVVRGGGDGGSVLNSIRGS